MSAYSDLTCFVITILLLRTCSFEKDTVGFAGMFHFLKRECQMVARLPITMIVDELLYAT
jgi:hypothetical protein